MNLYFNSQIALGLPCFLCFVMGFICLYLFVGWGLLVQFVKFKASLTYPLIRSLFGQQISNVPSCSLLSFVYYCSLDAVKAVLQIISIYLSMFAVMILVLLIFLYLYHLSLDLL